MTLKTGIRKTNKTSVKQYREFIQIKIINIGRRYLISRVCESCNRFQLVVSNGKISRSKTNSETESHRQLSTNVAMKIKRLVLVSCISFSSLVVLLFVSLGGSIAQEVDQNLNSCSTESSDPSQACLSHDHFASQPSQPKTSQSYAKKFESSLLGVHAFFYLWFVPSFFTCVQGTLKVALCFWFVSVMIDF